MEYQLKGVNQIQVNEKSGLTFARGLALDFAPRPGRDSHRRNSRRRNRADRRAGVAHRPFGFFHAAHQRRARRAHAARGHGRRAVSRRLVARSRARATPRPRAVSALQAGRTIPRRRRRSRPSSAFRRTKPFTNPSAAANAATPDFSAATRFSSGWTRTRKSAS